MTERRMNSPGTRDWRQSAKAAVVQFAIIFVAVSLSFVAEDWRQSLGEGRQEQRVLAGIASDLALDSAEIQWHVEANAQAAEAALWWHFNWDREELPNDSVSWALAALNRGSPYSPIRAEYEAAKSSGRLQLLTNADLRGRIAEYYEQDQQHQVRVNEINIAMSFNFLTAMMPHVIYASEFEGATFPAARLSGGWEEVRADVSLRNSLVHTLVFRRLSARQLTAYADRSRDLRSLILTELDR